MRSFEDWLADYRFRASRHDECVAALAHRIALQTDWTVRARDTPGFPAPFGLAVDVECHRADGSPLCLEVEILEALARRETIRRLGRLVASGREGRVVIVADEEAHEEALGDAERLLSHAGLTRLSVAAIAPDTGTITGADWWQNAPGPVLEHRAWAS